MYRIYDAEMSPYRTIAWAAHGAAFAATFILVEVVASFLLLASAWQAES